MILENGALIVTARTSSLENNGATFSHSSSACAFDAATPRIRMRTIRSGDILVDLSVAQVVKV